MTTTLPKGRQQQGAQQGAPRSGGRTAGEQRTTARGGVAARGSTGRRAAGRSPVEDLMNSPVVGTAALKVERAPQRRPQPDETPRLRVAPPAPVRTPRTPFVALVLVLVITGVVGILVLNTKINENVFRLHELKESQSALDLRQQQLEQDIAQKASPVELSAAARRLGLVPSRTPTFIVLPDGRKLGVPQPASGG